MIKKLIALFVSTVLSLIVAEFVLRSIFPTPLSFKSPQVRYVEHDARRFALMPGQDSAYSYSGAVTVGADGFRLVPESSHSDEAIGVMAIGDSFTFGMGVHDEETWPAFLQVLLNERVEAPFRVTNAGVISYSVDQILDVLTEHVGALEPTVVIHGLYWNDYQVAGDTGPGAPSVLTPEGYFVWHVPPSSDGLAGVNSLLAYLGSNVLKYAWGIATGLGATGYEIEYRALVSGELAPERWEPVEDFYRQLKAAGEAEGFEVYSVIMPVLGILESGQGASHPYAERMRALLDSLEIPYLDGVGLWHEEGLGPDTFLPYNRHLNAKGYHRLAEAIWEDVADLAR